MSLEFYRKHKVDIVYRLSLLEGISATYMQTSRLLEFDYVYNSSHDCSYHDYLVVSNIDQAFKFIYSRDRFSGLLDILLELHELVVAGLMHNVLEVGNFRVKPIRITGTTYVPNTHTFQENLDWFLKELEIISTKRDCVALYCKMMRRQLFADGNKRTSYIFANYLLSAFGYFLLLPQEGSYDVFLSKLKIYYEDETQLNQLVDYLVRYYLVEVV